MDAKCLEGLACVKQFRAQVHVKGDATFLALPMALTLFALYLADTTPP